MSEKTTSNQGRSNLPSESISMLAARELRRP